MYSGSSSALLSAFCTRMDVTIVAGLFLCKSGDTEGCWAQAQALTHILGAECVCPHPLLTLQPGLAAH